jgi:type II secretion system protein G
MKARGFSLIEMLIVITIIGTLAGLMLPNLLKSQDKAKETSVKAVLHAFQTALESYNVDTLAYPAGTNLSAKGLYDILATDGYLKTAPVNPFTGKAYEDGDEAGKILYSLNSSTGLYTLTGYKRNGSTVLMTLTNS